MNSQQEKEFARRIATMLLSHAAHGLATSALAQTGEITLRDGLVVAAAAEAAGIRQSWIINREVVPAGWADAPVDLLVQKNGNNNTIITLGGVELKWWRKTDAANSANRRRDLIRDFIRAGSLYQQVNDFSFVALLSTEGSWAATTTTKGTDKGVMSMLSASAIQKWNLKKMIASKAVEGAMRSLRGKVPMPNVFHTELLCTRSIYDSTTQLAFARVWKVKKPQNTIFLNDATLEKLIPPRIVASDENDPVNTG